LGNITGPGNYRMRTRFYFAPSLFSGSLFIETLDCASKLTEVLDLVAKINADECVGCGACEDVCPQSAIKVTDVAVINEPDCVDCGACVDECPNNAITMDE